jgi:16S rRNA processing protein RimM
MRKEDCFYLGKIAKKFSFKGEVLAYLDTDEPELYENLNQCLLNATNTWFLFFYWKVAQKISSRIRFEDVSNEEEADAILVTIFIFHKKMLPNLPVTNSIFTK